MSFKFGLNNPVLVPLLPITGSFAVPFTAYFAFLSARVVKHRLDGKQPLGDGSQKSKSSSSSSSSSGRSSTSSSGRSSRGDQLSDSKLFVASRAHSNFAENVPLAFALAAVVELNGGNRKILTGAMGALFAFRVLHAELGMQREDALGLGRPVGYYGTLASMMGLAGYAAFLVKGFWGF
ncbi:Membrane-associated proteins in eicosanoid and glutathione metabolism [Apiospora sp. TS-2023a]|uniref:Membrane-associated proteins in eicosanoid and glutathione metabolism n=1 Tax=Apiospora saccharicola TaxID=335842 RepID=A0ABR1WNQ8_9PEZI